jgi:hypothetical protein
LRGENPTVGMLLALLQNNGECSSMNIRQALGLKDRSHIHKSFLQTALVAGYIEMALSENQTVVYRNIVSLQKEATYCKHLIWNNGGT